LATPAALGIIWTAIMTCVSTLFFFVSRRYLASR
jgi:hypothetical protein